jgi:hypothetical protein
MLTRKFKKKMMGGMNRPNQTPNHTNIIDTNNIFFANLFTEYITSISDETIGTYIDTYISLKKTNPEQVDLKNMLYIYIGLIDQNGVIFGHNSIPKTQGINSKLFILDTPYNRRHINKFKLHIMSIMANYTLKNGHTLLTDLDTPIKALDIPKIIEILEIKEDSTLAVKPPPTPLQNDDIIELYIYREFGIKCSGGKECYNEITDNFYKLNEGTIPNLKSSNNELIRNLYVNIFDYITGSEVPTIGNKESAYTSCIMKTHKSITDLNSKLNKDEFIGSRTKYYFNIKKLIMRINIIRIEVNKSVNIKSTEKIPDI